MKKIVTVIGARPQFIKASVISRLINGPYAADFSEILVHTGQHYDENMSKIFFEEMKIPEPDVNLEVGSGPHGKMTGQMLAGIEKILLREKPDYLLTYGDTNSTLAGSLAASKLHIPVIHVEAGLRSFNKKMPEEQNRILTDHVSSYLLCPTEEAVKNLRNEGLTVGVYHTGDIMLDASLYYRNMIGNSRIPVPESFMLITIHRAENTDNPERMRSIVDALNAIDNVPGILPLHPRTKKIMGDMNLHFKEHIQVIDPLGFLDMLYLEKKCSIMVTDSGGIQKEAYFFKKPCITLRDQTEWVETVEAGWNSVVGADSDRIYNAIKNVSSPVEYPEFYGDGHAGEEILDILKMEAR